MGSENDRSYMEKENEKDQGTAYVLNDSMRQRLQNVYRINRVIHHLQGKHKYKVIQIGQPV